ncbi:MAG TPA: hypothetical protein VLT61_02525 [Anaeromyxobacteraceae bacterium]|nr:hypothetical protein [Anaeromyxobacteraceae bacterium]
MPTLGAPVAKGAVPPPQHPVLPHPSTRAHAPGNGAQKPVEGHFTRF